MSAPCDKVLVEENVGTVRARKYTVHLIPDDEERGHAIAAYEKGWHGIVPDFEIPAHIKALPVDLAQEWLDKNPLEKLYYRLHLLGDGTDDASLERLTLFPEVRDVVIMAKAVTDDGVKSLARISGITSLVIYSPLLTNKSLEHLASLRSLEILDLQGCPGIDQGVAKSTMCRAFDHLTFYPPFPRAD